MRPLRALFCTDTYPPQVNGVSVVTALSVNGLLDRGWECAVVAPSYPDGTPSAFPVRADDPVVMTTLPSWPLPVYPDVRLSLPLVRRVERAVRLAQPDIVHAQTEFVIGRLGARAARRAGVSLVTSYHTDFGKYADVYGMSALRSTVTRSIAAFHRSAERTYTPSEPSANALRAMGVPHVEVWGRGVDINVFSPQRRAQGLRDSLGVGDGLLFLHVGRLAAEKDVESILAAFAEARMRLSPRKVQLVIAGAGPRADALRARAPGNTTFLGHLNRATDLPSLYASADAFLFASTTETLGLVVLEAMASGVPVIAAPEGGVSDHLRHGVNGLAYPAGNIAAFAHAIERVAIDELLRRELAVGARRTAEQLSWDNELDRLDESYREIIDRSAMRQRGGTVTRPSFAGR